MKSITSIFLLTFVTLNLFSQTDFLSEQKRYKRVRTAIDEKEELLIEKLKVYDIGISELNIMILAYKSESEIEIFAKKKTSISYNKLATYKVCSKSGELGPKRKQGDLQVPEGFYFIDRFNPASSFLLSLGINYPNHSDRLKSNSANLGGDIFIHGDCVTIGCLPMTNDKIKEIYLYAINARNNGQERVPVYIFPFRMTERNFKKYKTKYVNNTALIEFWTNLKMGYNKFEKEHKDLIVSVSKNGDYIFD